MGTYFPGISSPLGSFPVLAIPAIVLVVALLFSLYILHWKKKSHAAFLETPDYQIQQLARKTVDYGVAYSEITFGKLLGKGSQGEVFLAQWRGLDVAVKKVDTRTVPPEIVDEFCAEADIMRRLRHPCLTLFMGLSLEHPYLSIVTELVGRGSLFDILHEDATGFTWKRALQIMNDIASGMTYLHGHSPPIIHRDLKSLNILIAQNWRAKVADFGMSRFQQDPSEQKTMTQCGSPLWMAPEMIKNDPYNEKADVYSFAIVAWELYTRRVPYRELNLSPSALVVKVVRDGLRPDLPKHCPRKVKNLLRACWHKDPAKRPPFTEILKMVEDMMQDKSITAHKPTLEDGQVDESDDEEEEQFTESAQITPGDPSTGMAVTKTADQTTLGGPFVEAAQLQDEYDALRANTEDGWIVQLKGLKITSTRYLGESELKDHPSTAHGHAPGHSCLVTSNDPPAKPRAHLVYRATYRGKNVVVKKCPVSAASLNTTNGAGIIPSDITHTDRGMLSAILRQASNCRHPNLVMFMGAFLEYDYVGVIEEEVTRGSLSSILSTPSIPLEWDQSLQFLLDAAAGLASLEALGMVHPDLSTKRLLVTNAWRVKIAGYAFVHLDRRLSEASGFAKDGAMSNANAPRIFETKINLWSAPETFDQDEPACHLTYDAATAKTMASNVYSFGLIMWSVMSRRLPFDGKFGPKLRQKIREGFRLPVPTTLPSRFRSLIKTCWASDRSKRPKFENILNVLQEIKSEGPPAIKLDDANSKLYHSVATVFAHVSKDPITILKDTGKNLGQKQNVLVAHSTKPPSAALNPDQSYWESFTDLHMMDAEVFARNYERVIGGHDFEYRKSGQVRARRMDENFAIRIGGGGNGNGADNTGAIGIIESGNAGDYIVENSAGDQWVEEGKAFDSTYVEVPSTDATATAHPQSNESIVHITNDTAHNGEVHIQLVGMGGGSLIESTDSPHPHESANVKTKPTPSLHDGPRPQSSLPPTQTVPMSALASTTRPLSQSSASSSAVLAARLSNTPPSIDQSASANNKPRARTISIHPHSHQPLSPTNDTQPILPLKSSYTDSIAPLAGNTPVSTSGDSVRAAPAPSPSHKKIVITKRAAVGDLSTLTGVTPSPPAATTSPIALTPITPIVDRDDSPTRRLIVTRTSSAD